MHILEDAAFRRAVKRLKLNQKSDLYAAIRLLAEQPEAGQLKKADLTGIRIYKFRMTQQLTLLAYSYDPLSDTINLFAVGSHENFYRNLKK